VRVVFLGPPGAGKGTQASTIAVTLGVPHVSTGDIFRANVSQGTPLGREAQRYMDAGNLVPDEVTNAMVADRLTHDDASGGFLLDGYPRTTDQADFLARVLLGAGTGLDAVVELDAPDDVVVPRLLTRAQESGRVDDTREVIQHRMDVYRAQTAPLVDYYQQRSLLRRVDGVGSVADVTERILAALRG
jgi:adenylate kinase